MKQTNVQRELKPYEKQRPWLIIGGGVSLLMCCMTSFVMMLGGNVRGYTTFGVFMGIVAVVLALLTFVYSMRKRTWQENPPQWIAKRQGTMMMWLWAHVYLGILALVAAIFHAGYGLLTFEIFTTGKILFAIFLLLALSGVAWRLIYRVIPKQAQPEIGNYSQDISIGRAQERLIEIEKVAAGKSNQFHQIKEALINQSQTATQIEQAIRRLDPIEQVAMNDVKQLAESRQRALQRHERQTYYQKILQGSRWVHIPLIALFIPLLGWHIFAVYDWPAKMFPPYFGAYRSSEDCIDCHEAIVLQWRDSMHAHALTSPVTIVQTNQVIAQNLADAEAPDPQYICNNCHAPVGTMITDQGTLPLDPPLFVSEEAINEGVDCATCHQYAGDPVSGGGGLASIFQEDLQPGRTYFGASDDPTGNAVHKFKKTDMYEQSETLCQSCHNVNLDRDGDGEIVQGIDLVLQTTYEEYEDYREEGGGETCITCHMPPVVDQTRSAEAASIPFEQDGEAPERLIHHHGFVGVDYPLDTVAESDPQRADREALLQEAALISLDEVFLLDDGSMSFNVNIQNNDLGHRLPTGFAFARQMWFEVTAVDETGTIVFASGLLANNTDDLCDSDTMDDPGNPMPPFMVGCDFSDPQLVNFQQKLVDDVDRIDEQVVQVGEETWLQNLNGGVVARTRPIDGQVLSRIFPNETRTFTYFIPADNLLFSTEVTLVIRLRFRNLPPYFLRILADHQPVDEIPQIEPIIPNLQIVDMAQVSETFIIR